MDSTTRFIAGLPKAELHIHIEGSLEPELMVSPARRNGVTLPYDSLEALRAAYAFNNLQDFLDIYYQGTVVLLTKQDFHDLTRAYLLRARADNLLHTEIFFDPQRHTERGVAFETVLDRIPGALVEGAAELGISSRLILCFLRHLDAKAARKTLDSALGHKQRIFAVGLDSSEVGHPPRKFRKVFAKARHEGFRTVAHAGEEGPPAYIREALDALGVSRIDHGNRALEDDTLIARPAVEQIPLTVCPLSNLKLRVIPRMKAHPLKQMIAKGLMVTVNSDDPAYFGGYINDNYHALHRAPGLTRDDFADLARNSFKASFLDDADKQTLIARLDAYLADKR